MLTIVVELQGHRIILPEGISVAEPLTLILIGSGKVLLLKNVTIVHAESLPACLEIGAGGRLFADSKDEVIMLKGSDPELAKLESPVGSCLHCIFK